MTEASHTEDMSRIDLEAKVVDAALTLAAERGWNAVSMAELARAAEVPLARLYAVIPGRPGVLSAFSRRIDATVMAESEAAFDPDDTPRDRLFEVLMLRFDALNRRRDGALALMSGALRDPASAAAGGQGLLRSMGWMLETAGISTGGREGVFRAGVLTAIYLQVLRVWSRDDTADLSRTMAALDKGLRRAGRRLVPGAPRGGADAAGPGPARPFAPAE